MENPKSKYYKIQSKSQIQRKIEYMILGNEYFNTVKGFWILPKYFLQRRFVMY